VKIVYLEPQSPRRMELRSDTLWGLICWGIRLVWDEKTLLNTIALYNQGNPPFLVSSAFPFQTQSGKRILFFPKPHFQPFRLSESEMNPDTMQDYKQYKKINYIPLSTFRALLSNQLSEKDYFLNRKEEWQNLPSIFGKKEIVLHNSIDRLTGSSLKEGGLYPTEDYYFNTGEGLFFLLNILNNDYQSILSGLWTFFEQMGMGGDATTGKGFYKFAEQEFTEEIGASDGERFVTLSLYYPSPEERQNFAKNPDQLWYQLVQRKGKIGGKFFVTPHIHKQSVTMFSEGSSFPLNKKPFYGAITLVKNVSELPHKVYQYGYAFAVSSKQ